MFVATVIATGIIVAVVVVLLFGSNKLPDLARGLGQSMRILKAESRGSKDDASASEPTDKDSSDRT